MNNMFQTTELSPWNFDKRDRNTPRINNCAEPNKILQE